MFFILKINKTTHLILTTSNDLYDCYQIKINNTKLENYP